MSTAPNSTVGLFTSTASDCTAANLIPIVAWSPTAGTTAGRIYQCQAAVHDGDMVPNPGYCFAWSMATPGTSQSVVCHMTFQPGDYTASSAGCGHFGLSTLTDAAYSTNWYGYSGATGNYYRCGNYGSAGSLQVTDSGVQGAITSASTQAHTDAGTAHTDALASQGSSTTTATLQTGDTSAITDGALATYTPVVLLSAVLTGIMLVRGWDFAKNLVRS